MQIMEKLSRATKLIRGIDWILVCSLVPLVGAGLVTMHAFVGESPYFNRQMLWVLVSFAVLFFFYLIDFRFLRRTSVLVVAFIGTLLLLALLIFFGSEIKGAKSWFNLGFFSFQPSDPAKIILILVLAKYFSRRHVEIKHMRHILVSGLYAGSTTLLVLLQPDFGSAIIIFFLWFGIILFSGISKKHLALVILSCVTVLAGLWTFGFEQYQKDRILSFLDPLADVQGIGYNAYQSTIAIGSGELLGKGIGFGTQSRLQFLPEHETDFIFSAFAEEWGFIGSMLILVFFGTVLYRIFRHARYGASNFESYYAIGLAMFFFSHIIVHIGMNIGLLPVTGTPLPFLSYGGSHLLTEFAGIGILLGMHRYARVTPVSMSATAHREQTSF